MMSCVELRYSDVVFLFAVAFLFLVLLLLPVIVGRDPAPPLPANSNIGEYASYKLQVIDDYTVAITIRSQKPAEWIKAQTDAFERIEKFTGLKAIKVWSAGTPTQIFVCLERPVESVEKVEP